MGCSGGCLCGTMCVISRGHRRECILKEDTCVHLSVFGVTLVVVPLVSCVCFWLGDHVGNCGGW